jgi:hypothetical protein
MPSFSTVWSELAAVRSLRRRAALHSGEELWQDSLALRVREVGWFQMTVVEDGAGVLRQASLSG